MRTLLAEWERALRRRITIVLVLAALAVTVITGVIALLVNDDQETLEREYQQQRAAQIEDCINDPYRWSEGFPEIVEVEPGGPVATVFPEEVDDEEPSEEEKRERCTQDADMWMSEPEAFTLRDLWDSENEEGILFLPATLLMLCGLGAGASMIGAEWKANTVTTLLCWEPRRSRLLGARMLATFSLAMLIAIVLQLAFSAAFVPTAALKGTLEGLDSAWWSDYLGAVIRIGVLTGGAATLGLTVASIARSTAGGMGAVMLWIAIGEQLLGALRPQLIEWLIAPNLAALTIAQEIREPELTVTVAGAAMRMALYLVLIIVVALGQFERRDVAN